MVTHELHYIRVCCEDKYIFLNSKFLSKYFMSHLKKNAIKTEGYLKMLTV